MPVFQKQPVNFNRISHFTEGAYFYLRMKIIG